MNKVFSCHEAILQHPPPGEPGLCRECSRQRAQRLGAAIRTLAGWAGRPSVQLSRAHSQAGIWCSGGVLSCPPGYLPERKGVGGEGATASLPSFDSPWRGVQAAPWLPTSCLGTLEWKIWCHQTSVSSTPRCPAWVQAWCGEQGEKRPMWIQSADRLQVLALLPPCSTLRAFQNLCFLM